MPTEADSTALQVRDLVVRYGDVVAVDRAALDARRDEITALVGPSGCGKTTLLRVVAGFEQPAAGSVTISGRVVAGPRAWIAPERRSVGMVFQQGALFPHLDVWSNVGFGVSGRPDCDVLARNALELVGLADLARRYPDELSGGQQQRVALARALAPLPAIILLDEPFASLDAALRQRVRDEVCSILRQAGTTAVIVTHDQEEALSIADRLVVMQRGRVLQDGTPEEVYERPRTVAVARFIGDGQLIDCSIDGGRLESELGPAKCDSADGPARLLVRPEDLLLQAAGAGPGVEGRVAERRFYGHDQISRVQLRTGGSVQVRVGGHESLAEGTGVCVRLRPKRYRVYSTDDAAELLGRATPLDAPP